MGTFIYVLLWCLTFVAIWGLACAHAGDPTGYWARESAAGRAPPKAWWDALQSGKGLCCSFADGQRIEDVDWGTESVTTACPGQKSGGAVGCMEIKYWVSLNGKRYIVPDSALVTEPNKFGQAVVWPYKDLYGQLQIRCFMPGAQG